MPDVLLRRFARTPEPGPVRPLAHSTNGSAYRLSPDREEPSFGLPIRQVSTHGMHCRVTVVVGWPKPYVDLASRCVDSAHEVDLLGSLNVVFLVDTELVYPEEAGLKAAMPL